MHDRFQRVMRGLLVAAALVAVWPVCAKPLPAGITVTEEWPDFTLPVSQEAQAVFQEATMGLCGVSFEAIGFSYRPGYTNYCFVCISQPVVPDPPKSLSLVYVCKSGDNKATIAEIKALKP